MDESLTEQRRVNDEGLRIVKYCLWGRMVGYENIECNDGTRGGSPG